MVPSSLGDMAPPILRPSVVSRRARVEIPVTGRLVERGLLQAQWAGPVTLGLYLQRLWVGRAS